MKFKLREVAVEYTETPLKISSIVYSPLVAVSMCIFLWLADIVQKYMHRIIDKVNAGSYKHAQKRNIGGAIPTRPFLFLLKKNIFFVH